MRRGSLQIVSEILSTVKDPSTKTGVVHGANLGYAQAERYLNSLLENNLITFSKRKNTEYEITKKGREFLEYYEELETLVHEKKGYFSWNWKTVDSTWDV